MPHYACRSASGKSWTLLGRKNSSREDNPYESPILLWDDVDVAKQLCLIDFDFMRVRYWQSFDHKLAYLATR